MLCLAVSIQFRFKKENGCVCFVIIERINEDKHDLSEFQF